MGIMVSWLSNVLWRGMEPSSSFSVARDYARSAVASWTIIIDFALYIPAWNKRIMAYKL